MLHYSLMQSVCLSKINLSFLMHTLTTACHNVAAGQNIWKARKNYAVLDQALYSNSCAASRESHPLQKPGSTEALVSQMQSEPLPKSAGITGEQQASKSQVGGSSSVSASAPQVVSTHKQHRLQMEQQMFRMRSTASTATFYARLLASTHAACRNTYCLGSSMTPLYVPIVGVLEWFVLHGCIIRNLFNHYTSQQNINT